MRRGALKSLVDGVLVAVLLGLGAALGWQMYGVQVATALDPALAERLGLGAPAETSGLAAADADQSAVPAASVVDPGIPLLRRPDGLGQYRRIVNRPLFSPTRRPPEPRTVEAPREVAAPAPIRPVVQTGQFRLIGVVIEEGDQVALLRDQKSRSLVKAKTGEVISGWTVRTIEARSVSLIQDGVIDTVLMRENTLSDADRQRMERDARAAEAAAPVPNRNAGRVPNAPRGVVTREGAAPAPGPASRVPSQRLRTAVP